MITFGSYKDRFERNELAFSISVDKGLEAGFKGYFCPFLAPKKYLFDIWRFNSKNLSYNENNEYFIREYYLQNLRNLDPEKILEIFKDNNVVFVDYEYSLVPNIIAIWFSIFLEISIEKKHYSPLEIAEREFIKSCLIKVIQETKDMKGFNHLRSLYLYEKSVKLQAEADELSEIYPETASKKRESSELYKKKALTVEYLYQEINEKQKSQM